MVFRLHRSVEYVTLRIMISLPHLWLGMQQTVLEHQPSEAPMSHVALSLRYILADLSIIIEDATRTKSAKCENRKTLILRN